MSSAANLKARHYAALSSRLRQLSANLGETESQMDALAAQLGAMSQLAVACGSQFMSVSRLLDEELQETTRKREAEHGA
ncbi:hypothetical protein Q5752_003997 [Cryptotrichosporon argae]